MSKASEDQDSSSTEKSFAFVLLSSNEAATGRVQSKYVIRSHLARLQHAKTNTRVAMRNMQPWTVNMYKHKDVARAVDQLNSGSRVRHVEDLTHDDDNTSDASTNAALTKSVLHDDQLYRARRAEAAVPKFLGGTQQEDPFWTYPVDYAIALPEIFAHYIQNIAVDIPDLDGPDDRGLLRRRWFPMAMTEAATMYAVLLMSAAHYCTVNPSQTSMINLLSLKARALSEINTALRDPSRAMTDATIGAVMKMAAYEAIFGDSSVFGAHMSGLKLMVRMRGGLRTLGLDGLLERMLVWVDLNAAHLTGSNRVFSARQALADLEINGPDPYHFAGIS